MFSGSPGKPPGGGDDRGNIHNRPGKDDGMEHEEEKEVEEWEMTVQERRIFRETGVRPARTAGDDTRGESNAQEQAALSHSNNEKLKKSQGEREADALRRELRNAIQNALGPQGTDDELLEVLNERFYNLPEAERLYEADILTRAVHFMEVTSWMVPREAVLALAQAGWNAEVAIERFFEGRDEGPSRPVERRAGGRHEIPDSESELSEPPKEPEKGPEKNSSEESEEEPDRLELMRRLNPNVDKDSAKKGHRDNSKLTVTLKNPGGKADTVYKYNKTVNGTMDFTSSERIRALNRWRAQIFRRNLGNARPPRPRFHDQEKRFLVDAHMDFETQTRAAGRPVKWSRMNWDQITADFNTRFQGRHLPGNPDARPHRTRDSLRTERNRIKEITDHTGITPRDQKQVVEGSDEDEEEGQAKPKYPRRGDPGPGKSPRRDSDDESDNGGGGLGVGSSGIKA